MVMGLGHPQHRGFPKLGVSFWGILIIRIILYWGLYFAPPILGSYHMGPHNLEPLYGLHLGSFKGAREDYHLQAPFMGCNCI